LDAEQMEGSISRIQRLKEKYRGLDDGEIRADDFTEARAVAERAVTLVRDQTGSIPLRPGRTAVMHLGDDLRLRSVTTLGHELLQLRANVEVVKDPDALRPDGWANVVVSSLSWRSVAHADAIRGLHSRFGTRLVVVGVGNPYELARFPEVEAYIAAYGPDPASLRAAARVLAGDLTPTGRLPVTIPGLHPRGHPGVTTP
jgi:beta-N-acetylhexosaminidase